MENVYVRVDSEVLREFDIECANLRLRRPQALSDAMVSWLREMRGSWPGRPPKRKEGELSDKLANIIASGDNLAISAVSQCIEAFANRLQPAGTRAP